jgi:uncharacterized protein
VYFLSEQPLSRPKTPAAFHVMVKPRGAICNLDCQYCFYLQKESLYPQGVFRMSEEVLESYTRQYLEAQRTPEVTFAWQGGEPTLMGVDFYRRAVALQQQFARPGTRVQNSFQTNGTLLDDEWCRFFHDNNFLIGLSLDGPRPLHDAYRVDKGGKPTFDRVMGGLDLLKRHQVEFNLLACVNNLTAQRPLEVYRFFRDEVSAHFIQFIPIVEPSTQPGEIVSARSVGGAAYGRFLNAIFDEWVKHDVGQVYVQLFDVALGIWAGYPAGLCIFDQTCGLAMALEHNGDLYACDHFVDPPHFLGNLTQKPLAALVAAPAQQRFGQDKRAGLPRKCIKCKVRFACNGGCPKDRLLTTADGEPGLNYLCDDFKAFFGHIDPPMRTMASLLQARRAPAEIMQMLADKRPRPKGRH